MIKEEENKLENNEELQVTRERVKKSKEVFLNKLKRGERLKMQEKDTGELKSVQILGTAKKSDK